MTEYASFEDLTAESPEDDEERLIVLKSGKIVRVRGLSRYEWFLAGKNTDGDANAFEAELIAMGMDEPRLTKKQAEAWRKKAGSYADISAVSDRIRKLTGVDEGADKSDLRELRSESE